MSAPTLTRSDISTGNQWIRLHAPESEIYRDVTGAAVSDPPGLTVVAARSAFTRGRQLPPGGVLLSIEGTFYRELTVDDTLEFRCEVDDRVTSSGRRILEVHVELRVPGSDLAVGVKFLLLWPNEESPDERA